jgi:hypothetical protein
MGIVNGYVPILKWGSPFQNREYWQPRSEIGIMPLFWLLVVCESKDRKKYGPHSETGSSRSVMGSRQKKSKSKNSRSKKEFVPNRGLTHRMRLYVMSLHLACGISGFVRNKMVLVVVASWRISLLND